MLKKENEKRKREINLCLSKFKSLITIIKKTEIEIL